MATVTPFYSVHETYKSPSDRVYHKDDQCGAGKEIPPHERRSGENDYRLCDECRHLAFWRRLATALQLSRSPVGPAFRAR
jgi:hypothetical protein